MAIRTLLKMLSAKAMFGIQKTQYTDAIPLTDTIDAGTTKLCKANVSFVGHFLLTSITGRFSTLHYPPVEAVLLDNGVCALSAQLLDGAGQRTMFSDYIPLDLFLSPGRTRRQTGLVAGVVTQVVNNLQAVAAVASKCDNAPSLFEPYAFEYLFTANSDIQMSIRNDSTTTQFVDIMFKGIRLDIRS